MLPEHDWQEVWSRLAIIPLVQFWQGAPGSECPPLPIGQVLHSSRFLQATLSYLPKKGIRILCAG